MNRLLHSPISLSSLSTWRTDRRAETQWPTPKVARLAMQEEKERKINRKCKKQLTWHIFRGCSLRFSSPAGNESGSLFAGNGALQAYVAIARHSTASDNHCRKMALSWRYPFTPANDTNAQHHYSSPPIQCLQHLQPPHYQVRKVCICLS
jgi:hypothetical protein